MLCDTNNYNFIKLLLSHPSVKKYKRPQYYMNGYNLLNMLLLIFRIVFKF